MNRIFLIFVIIFLSSCTRYVVEKVAPDGSVTNIHVSSTRSFEQPDLYYKRDGNDAEFTFKAANADNNADMFAGAMMQLIQMMQQMMLPKPE